MILSAHVAFGIHRDRDAVVGDRQLDVLHAGLLAGRDFGGADRPRGVADVDFGAAEFLEAAAGAGDAHGHAGVFFDLLKFFRDRFADREDGARAVEADQRRAGRRRRTTGAGVLRAPAAAGERDDHEPIRAT